MEHGFNNWLVPASVITALKPTPLAAKKDIPTIIDSVKPIDELFQFAPIDRDEGVIGKDILTQTLTILILLVELRRTSVLLIRLPQKRMELVKRLAPHLISC